MMTVFEYWTIYSILFLFFFIFFFEKDLFYHLIGGLNIEYKKANLKKKLKYWHVKLWEYKRLCDKILGVN